MNSHRRVFTVPESVEGCVVIVVMPAAWSSMHTVLFLRCHCDDEDDDDVSPDKLAVFILAYRREQSRTTELHTASYWKVFGTSLHYFLVKWIKCFPECNQEAA